MMYRNLGMGWIGMIIGGILFIGLMVLLVYAIVRLFQGTGHPGPNRPYGPDRTGEARALDILAERYARGEINDEEYARMKSELKK